MSFRPVGPDLRALLRDWLENPRSRRAVLQHNWQRAVGDRVGRRCRPLQLAEGVLTVEVTDPSWAAQLEGMTAELARRVNAAFGGDWVRRIEWVDERGDPLPSRRGR